MTARTEPTAPATPTPSDPHAGRVLVLIPAYNEERTIGDIVGAVRAADLPVLVVDDGSSDRTARVAREAGAEVVSHGENLRKGVALATGFRRALEEGYDAVITMDADGQHDPADLGKFVDAWRAGKGDLIIGERTPRQMPMPRPITTPLGSLLLSLALGIRVADNQSGYRLLTRRFMEGLQLTSSGYEAEVEMIWEAVRLGMVVTWVPIRTIYYKERKSGFHPLKDTARFLAMVWRIWRRRRRHEAAARGDGGDT